MTDTPHAARDNRMDHPHAERVSEHFSLAELTITSVRKYPNVPDAEALDNMRHYLAPGLEAVRGILSAIRGKSLPLLVNSGYRSVPVNRVVGGARTSAHVLGLAADFICPGFGAPIDVCRAIAASSLAFDQMIEEGTWVHLSFDLRQRGMILTKGPGGSYLPGLTPAQEA